MEMKICIRLVCYRSQGYADVSSSSYSVIVNFKSLWSNRAALDGHFFKVLALISLKPCQNFDNVCFCDEKVQSSYNGVLYYQPLDVII
jgi:hypothetical protein